MKKGQSRGKNTKCDTKIVMSVPKEDFDLCSIFECGQCFRWSRISNGDGVFEDQNDHTISYIGTAGGRVALISQNADELTISEYIGADKDSRPFWYSYFDLERDYGAIKKRITKGDEVMKRVVSFGSGIRILRQDPWEATLSFIISQNNNIPRIKKNIRELSEMFGKKLGIVENCEWYDVPAPEVLAGLTVDDLAPIKLGYRARYIIESAACIAERGMGVLHDDLDSLCGVGPKVANCIRLFGLGKFDSFPIDVWIKKFMTELFGIEKLSEMEKFAEKRFGQYGGIAQQYMFYYMREK